MHENENRVYIDVNEMADAMQRKFRDYRIKKRGPFRALVRKAYDELTEMFAKKYCARDCCEDEDDEDEVDVEVFTRVLFRDHPRQQILNRTYWFQSDPQNTMLDGMLLKMYKRTQNKQNGNSSDKELIDISSDDDADKGEPNPCSKTNEPEPAEKSPQQKAGPSSHAEKPPVPTKEVEQLKTVNFKLLRRYLM